MTESQFIATAVSWFIVLVWCGVLTLFIDMVGVMMGWWTDETFFGVPPKGRP